MIKLYKEQTKSIDKIQKDLNLDKMRLYRYANGKCNIDKFPAGTLFTLSEYLNIEPIILFNKMKEWQKEKRENEKAKEKK